jgi:hypothetical protein
LPTNKTRFATFNIYYLPADTDVFLQPGAQGAGEISEALKLGELRDRNWSIVACSVIDGKGINEGMDWLS